ncbi:putative peptide zinc metalloprotease protein [Kitasatospora sp. MAP12-15]|uniref:peptidase M50 n=1 Tax=unclassified Kitasatospora TaxID=2633591 RepID=UPI002473A949|nr:peptidase M50 [Kitasatospora sp. MAP12-44]MDH6108739.1 putative peptide zinc metalloprotease protein [Kitasatospora sp. MAP12-44]
MSDTGVLGHRPRIRPEIRISRALLRGAVPIHLLKDPVSGRRLEVGVKEHFIIARLDGSRTLDEIGELYAREFRVRLGEAQWQQMLRLLYARGLLAGGGPAEPAPAPATRSTGSPSSLLSGRVRLVADAPALVDRLHQAIGFARRAGFLVPLLALVAALLVALVVQLGELVRETDRLFHQPVALAAAGAVLWVSLGLHELAHGLVGRAFGGRTTEIGLRWRLLTTYLYCEVEDVQFFARRREQIATAGAGVLMNLVFLLPCYPVWALLPAHAQARPFCAGLLLLGTLLALANLLPLPPLDGYKMLGHAVGSVQLATDSRRFAARLARVAVRRDTGALSDYPVRLRVVYGGYALGCAALAGAALAATGPLCRRLLPAAESQLAGYAPALTAGAALALWAVGLVAKARRTPDTTPGTTSRTHNRTSNSNGEHG